MYNLNQFQFIVDTNLCLNKSSKVTWFINKIDIKNHQKIFITLTIHQLFRKVSLPSKKMFILYEIQIPLATLPKEATLTTKNLTCQCGIPCRPSSSVDMSAAFTFTHKRDSIRWWLHRPLSMQLTKGHDLDDNDDNGYFGSFHAPFRLAMWW